MSEPSFDLSSFIPAATANKQIAKGSKRPYTVVAVKGESRLLLNFSIEPMKSPNTQNEACLAVVVRGMESPSPYSEAGSKFPAWGFRDLGEQFGSRTYKRSYPIVSLPCHPGQMLEFWTEGGFDDLICHRVIELLQADGAQALNGIEGLKLMTEEMVQPLLDMKQPTVLDAKEIVSAD